MHWAVLFLAYLIWCKFGTAGLFTDAAIVFGFAVMNYLDWFQKKNGGNRSSVSRTMDRKEYRKTLFSGGLLALTIRKGGRLYSEEPISVELPARRNKVPSPESL